MKTPTNTINATQFGKICGRVSIDRKALLSRKGKLSGEATLIRAVFWRLCKAGIKTKGCVDADSSKPAMLGYQTIVLEMVKTSSRPPFDGAPVLDALIDRHQNEIEGFV